MQNTKKIVLIVEDDEVSRLAMATIVTGLGLEPLTFGDPTEVLSGIRGYDLSLALIDIMMPKIDGYKLVNLLKKEPSFDKVPVIMVTAKDADAEMLDGYKSGADYYIRKPFSREQLEQGIRLFVK